MKLTDNLKEHNLLYTKREDIYNEQCYCDSNKKDVKKYVPIHSGCTIMHSLECRMTFYKVLSEKLCLLTRYNFIIDNYTFLLNIHQKITS